MPAVPAAGSAPAPGGGFDPNSRQLRAAFQDYAERLRALVVEADRAAPREINGGDTSAMMELVLKRSWDTVLVEKRRAAEAEKKADLLQKRQAEAQKAYLQEISMLRDQARPNRAAADVPELAANTLFYEPLKFVDERTRELVALIVREQLKILKNETDFQAERQERAEKLEVKKHEIETERWQSLQSEAESLRRYRVRCEVLEKEVDEEKRRGKDALQRAQAKHEQLEREISEKREEGRQREGKQRGLLAEAQTLKEAFDAERAQRTKWEDKAALLEEELRRRQQELDGVKRTMAKVSDARREESEVLERRCEELRVANADLAEQLGDRNEANAKLESGVAAAQYQLEKAAGEHRLASEAAERKLRELRGEVSAFRDRTSNLEINVTQLGAERAGREAALAEKTALLEAERKKVVDLESGLEELRTGLKREVGAKSALDKALIEERGQLAEFQEMWREQQKETASLRVEVQELKRNCEEERRRAVKFEETAILEAERRQLAVLRFEEEAAEKAAADAASAAVRAQLAEAEQRGDTLSEAVAEIQAEKEAIVAEKTATVAEKDELLEEKDSMEKRIAILENNVLNLKNIVQLNNEFYSKFGARSDHEGSSSAGDHEGSASSSSCSSYDEEAGDDGDSKSATSSRIAGSRRMKDQITSEIERSLVRESSPPLFSRSAAAGHPNASSARKKKRRKSRRRGGHAMVEGGPEQDTGHDFHVEEERYDNDYEGEELDGPWDFEESCDGSLVVTRRKFFGLSTSHAGGFASTKNTLRDRGSANSTLYNYHDSAGTMSQWARTARSGAGGGAAGGQRSRASVFHASGGRKSVARFWDERQSAFTTSQEALKHLDARLTQSLLWKKFSKTGGGASSGSAARNAGVSRMARSLTIWTAGGAQKDAGAELVEGGKKGSRSIHSARAFRDVTSEQRALETSQHMANHEPASASQEQLQEARRTKESWLGAGGAGSHVDTTSLDVDHALNEYGEEGPHEVDNTSNDDQGERQTGNDVDGATNTARFTTTVASSNSALSCASETSAGRGAALARRRVIAFAVPGKLPRNRSAGLREDLKAAWGKHSDLLRKTSEYLQETRWLQNTTARSDDILTTHAPAAAQTTASAGATARGRGVLPDALTESSSKWAASARRTVDGYGLIVRPSHPLLYRSSHRTDLRGPRLMRKLGLPEASREQQILKKLHNFYESPNDHDQAEDEEAEVSEHDVDGELGSDGSSSARGELLRENAGIENENDGNEYASYAVENDGQYSRSTTKSKQLFGGAQPGGMTVSSSGSGHQDQLDDDMPLPAHSRFIDRARAAELFLGVKPPGSASSGSSSTSSSQGRKERKRWERATFPPVYGQVLQRRTQGKSKAKHAANFRAAARLLDDSEKNGVDAGCGSMGALHEDQQDSAAAGENEDVEDEERGDENGSKRTHSNNDTQKSWTRGSKAKWTWTGVQATFGSKEPLSETLRNERRDRQRKLVELLGEILNVGVTTLAGAGGDQQHRDPTSDNVVPGGGGASTAAAGSRSLNVTQNGGFLGPANLQSVVEQDLHSRTVDPWVRDLFLKLRQALLDSQTDIADLEAHRDAVTSMLDHSEKHAKGLRAELHRTRKMHESTQSSSGFRVSKGDQFWQPAAAQAQHQQQASSHATTVARGLGLGRSNMWSQLTDDMQEQLHATETQLRNTFSKLDIETQQKLEAENLVSALEKEIRQLEDTFRNTQQGSMPKWDGSDPDLARGYNSDGDGSDPDESERERRNSAPPPEGDHSAKECAAADGVHQDDEEGGTDVAAQDLSSDMQTRGGALCTSTAEGASCVGPALVGGSRSHDGGPSTSSRPISGGGQTSASEDYSGAEGGYGGLERESKRELLQRVQELEREKEESERTISRLRLIINEMSIRLVRLKGNMADSERKGVTVNLNTKDANSCNYERMFRASGLGDFLSRDPGNVFNRLYADAIQRIRRLEDAQEKQRSESVLRVFAPEDGVSLLSRAVLERATQLSTELTADNYSLLQPVTVAIEKKKMNHKQQQPGGRAAGAGNGNPNGQMYNYPLKQQIMAHTNLSATCTTAWDAATVTTLSSIHEGEQTQEESTSTAIRFYDPVAHKSVSISESVRTKGGSVVVPPLPEATQEEDGSEADSAAGGEAAGRGSRARPAPSTFLTDDAVTEEGAFSDDLRSQRSVIGEEEGNTSQHSNGAINGEQGAEEKQLMLCDSGSEYSSAYEETLAHAPEKCVSPMKGPMLSPLSPIVDMHKRRVENAFTGGFAMNRKSPVKNGWK
eukprot:g1722.t1